MKAKFFFFVFISLMISLNGFSQSKETIINALENHKSGEGFISVDSEPGIDDLIGTPNKKVAFAEEVNEMQGFRIMAFMGNDPKTARTESSNRKALIEENFLNLDTYLSYDSPNWKLLVGDFVSYEDANTFKHILQKKFPNFGKEMYIVKDTINVPAETTN